jgi:hypothetical protein
MKKLKIIKVLGLVALGLLMSSLTLKGQSSDSEWRVVPISSLKYSNFIGEPISLIGDVVVININNQYYYQNMDINGRSLNFPIFANNLKTNKFMYPIGADDSISFLFPSIYQNIFYLVNDNRNKIYKIEINQDTILQDVIFYREQGKAFVNTVLENGNGDELIIAQGYNGIYLLHGDSIIREYPLPGIFIGSLAKWGNLIVFGGDKGQLGLLNPQTGEITPISNGMNFEGNVKVNVINGFLYASVTIDSKGYLYKYNEITKTWILITSTEYGFYSKLHFDALINEWWLIGNANAGNGAYSILRNDSVIFVPTDKDSFTEYIMWYRDTLKNHYGNNTFSSCGYFFNYNGQKYCVGVGMIGIIKKVLITVGIYNYSQRRIPIYPNPATGVINISGLEKETEVIVTDVTGKIVLLEKTIDRVNISTLVSGLYFLNISGYMPKKFIKPD